MFQPLETAGIRFRTLSEPQAPSLPRMDIAGFVGFAAMGPLDLPVAVEDAPRFREIFGPDPDLAWDDTAGRFERGHLGPAVEAFFANGGRRAHVVRVAGPGAETATFRLPGLTGAADGLPAPLAARSPGRWAVALTGEAAFERRRLRLRPGAGFAPGAPVGVIARSDGIAAGDLLELRLPGETLRAYLTVAATDPAGTLTLDTPHWFEPDPYGGPDPVPLAEAAALARFAAWQAGTPALQPALYLVRMILSARLGDGPVLRLRDLALGAAHPRWFGHLDPDAAAFAPGDSRFDGPDDPARQALRRAALAPRFPLAGVASANPVWWPPAGPDPLPLDPVSDGADGLDGFSAAPFLDPDLRSAGLGALKGEADAKILVRGTPATGLHALWPVEEIALLALPDAVHRPWLRAAPPPQDLPAGPDLSAPVMLPPQAARLSWTAVAGAEGYRLEMAAEPSFATPLRVIETADTSARLDLPTACPARLFFRVRGRIGGGIGPWSNTRGAWLPPETASPCGRPPIRHLDLAAAPAGSPDGQVLLTWGGAAPVEIEAADDPAFGAPAQVFAGTAAEWFIDQPFGTGTYLRARFTGPGAPHPWSNTVFVPPLPRSEFTLVTEREYDGADLLTLHTAALRFCAARADLTAALSVASFADPREHLASLRPVAGAGAATTAGVPPLTTGESPVFGYGALFHPWILLPGPDGPRAQPPDGPALGLAAGVARADGAWIAAANRPVAGALGVLDAPDQQDRLDLEGAGINPVLRDARGILTLSDWTLSDDSALRHMTIRRLLILVRRLALREGQALVFEPNGDPLRQLVQARFDQVMERLYLRGALRGRRPDDAFRVITDASVNPPQSVGAGRFIVELRLAPARPLAFLRVQLFQTGSAGYDTRELP